MVHPTRMKTTAPLNNAAWTDPDGFAAPIADALTDIRHMPSTTLDTPSTAPTALIPPENPGPPLASLSPHIEQKLDPRQPLHSLDSSVVTSPRQLDPREPIVLADSGTSTQLVSAPPDPSTRVITQDAHWQAAHTMPPTQPQQPNPYHAPGQPYGYPGYGSAGYQQETPTNFSTALGTGGWTMLACLLLGFISSGVLSLTFLIIAWACAMSLSVNRKPLQFCFLTSFGLLLFILMCSVLAQDFDPFETTLVWTRLINLILIGATSICVWQGLPRRSNPPGGTPW